VSKSRELTSLPILVMPFIAQARGDAPGWTIIVSMSIIAGATLIVLWRLLHTMRAVPAADQY
jgi:hypothetical protein